MPISDLHSLALATSSALRYFSHSIERATDESGSVIFKKFKDYVCSTQTYTHMNSDRIAAIIYSNNVRDFPFPEFSTTLLFTCVPFGG